MNKSNEINKEINLDFVFDDIINFLPDATYVIDNEKRIIIWNKALEKMTGIPSSEMIGKGNYAHALPFYGETKATSIDLLFQDDPHIIPSLTLAKSKKL